MRAHRSKELTEQSWRRVAAVLRRCGDIGIGFARLQECIDVDATLIHIARQCDGVPRRLPETGRPRLGQRVEQSRHHGVTPNTRIALGPRVWLLSLMISSKISSRRPFQAGMRSSLTPNISASTSAP